MTTDCFALSVWIPIIVLIIMIGILLGLLQSWKPEWFTFFIQKEN